MRISTTKHLLSCVAGMATFVSLTMCNQVKAQYTFTNQFNHPIATGTTSLPNVWHPDRYSPAGFSISNYPGGNAILETISSSQGGAANRPAGQQATFYNTQGRQLTLPNGTTVLKADLYVPSYWEDANKRMAGLWGVANDASGTVTGYPIIEFASDTLPGGHIPTPSFRGYDDVNGAWVNIGLPAGFSYDSWFTLEIDLNPDGSYTYKVGDKTLNMPAEATSVAITSVILEGYNYDPDAPLDATNPGTDYDIYWDNLSTTSGGNNVYDLSNSTYFSTIQAAVTSASANDSLVVYGNTFSEQVVISKSLKIRGYGNVLPTVDFTGATVTGKPALFDISADNVTIDSLHFNVDLSKLRSAIIASSTSVNTLNILNNVIDPYGTPAGSYSDRNAVSVNYGGSTNYRVNENGINNVLFKNNTVNAASLSTAFRSGFSGDVVAGQFLDNTLASISQDITVRFLNDKNISIEGNKINGGGIEINTPEKSGGKITIQNNIFDGTFGNSYTSSLRLKNNFDSKPTVVKNNTFINHTWGISLENYNADIIDGNTFTPLSSATAYRHITFNTKELSSTSGFGNPLVGGTFIRNTFNGSGAANGIGMAFYNHDNDNPVFQPIVLGMGDSENIFMPDVAKYVYLDSTNNQQTDNITTAFPEYTGLPATTTAYWKTDIDGSNNKFDIGNGEQVADDLTYAQTQNIHTKIIDRQDNLNLGQVFLRDAVTNTTRETANPGQKFRYPTIQSAINAASTVNGDTLVARSGVYEENIELSKSLKLLGSNAGIDPNTGTRLEESVIIPAAADTLNGDIVYVDASGSNSEINGFTLSGSNAAIANGFTINNASVATAEAIGAYDGISNAVVRNNIIRDLYYSGVDFYNNSGAATTGNIVSNNKFANINPQGIYGIGVLLYNNCYTNVSNNVFDSVAKGVQTGNFYKADPGTSDSISNNTFSNVGNIGIWHNLTYAGASRLVIANNTVNSSFPGSENKTSGIKITSQQNAVGVTVKNNAVSNVAYGYHLWNNPTTDTVTIAGGSATNTVYGVYANNFVGYKSAAASSNYKADSLSLGNASVAGIFVQDSGTANVKVSLTVADNSKITTSSTGILLQGSMAQATFAGTLPATLSGQTTYIDQVTNGGSVPNTDIDASEVAFDTPAPNTVGSALNYYQVQQIEGKVVDKDDNAALGQVYFKFPVINVTKEAASATGQKFRYYTIQNAIDAAASGDSLYATAWVYNEDVNVNKNGLKLNGDLNYGTDTTIIIGPMTTNPTLNANADNVAISNLMVTRAGNDANDFVSNPKVTGVNVGQARTGIVLQNLLVNGNRNGIYLNNVRGTTIRNCDIIFNRTGIQMANNCDNTSIINNNILNNWTLGIVLLNAGTGATATTNIMYNKIQGNWYSGIENRNPNTVLNLTGNNWGVDSVYSTTNPSGEPGYAAVWPKQYGGAGIAAIGNGYIISGATDRVDYTAWLPEATANATDNNTRPGYIPQSLATVYVDNASPVSGTLTKFENAANVVASNGTIVTCSDSMYAVLKFSNKHVTIDNKHNNDLYFDGIELSSDTISINKPVSVGHSFALSDAVINLNPADSLLIDAATATITPSTTGYVHGAVAVKNLTGSFVFPVGGAGGPQYIALNNTTGSTGNFTARYYNTGYNTSALSSQLQSVNANQYWDLERTAGDLGGKITLYDFSNAILPTSTIAHYTNDKWNDLGNGAVTSNPLTITSADVSTTFSPFTFGTTVLGLPVSLAGEFTAKAVGNTVLLSWATATETNNKGFEISRSKDGQNWETPVFISSLAVNGNSAQLLNYSSTDNSPYAGINYYKLTQVDLDGKSVMVGIKSVNITGGQAVSVYPNPATTDITVTNMKGRISVFDASGRLVVSQQAAQSNTVIHVQHLPAGIYFIKDEAGNSAKFSKK